MTVQNMFKTFFLISVILFLKFVNDCGSYTTDISSSCFEAPKTRFGVRIRFVSGYVLFTVATDPTCS